MTNLFIGIDPGRTNFAICYGTNETDFQIVEGNDRGLNLLYPDNLIKKLRSTLHLKCPIIPHAKNTYAFKYHPIICSEEPMTMPDRMRVLVSQSRDIGAIAYSMKKYPFWTCTQGEWKKHWRESGRCPAMKGNLSEAKYEAILNNHFGITRSPHAWSALGIYYYNLDNYDE